MADCPQAIPTHGIPLRIHPAVHVQRRPVGDRCHAAPNQSPSEPAPQRQPSRPADNRIAGRVPGVQSKSIRPTARRPRKVVRVHFHFVRSGEDGGWNKGKDMPTAKKSDQATPHCNSPTPPRVHSNPIWIRRPSPTPLSQAKLPCPCPPDEALAETINWLLDATCSPKTAMASMCHNPGAAARISPHQIGVLGEDWATRNEGDPENSQSQIAQDTEADLILYRLQGRPASLPEKG